MKNKKTLKKLTSILTLFSSTILIVSCDRTKDSKNAPFNLLKFPIFYTEFLTSMNSLLENNKTNIDFATNDTSFYETFARPFGDYEFNTFYISIDDNSFNPDNIMLYDVSKDSNKLSGIPFTSFILPNKIKFSENTVLFNINNHWTKIDDVLFSGNFNLTFGNQKKTLFASSSASFNDLTLFFQMSYNNDKFVPQKWNNNISFLAYNPIIDGFSFLNDYVGAISPSNFDFNKPLAGLENVPTWGKNFMVAGKIPTEKDITFNRWDLNKFNYWAVKWTLFKTNCIDVKKNQEKIEITPYYQKIFQPFAIQTGPKPTWKLFIFSLIDLTNWKKGTKINFSFNDPHIFYFYNG